MIEIEKNIPLPPRRGGKPTKYPLDKMKVGDSFFVPRISMVDLSATLQARAKKLKFKISVRKEKSGARVWRTA